MPKSTALHPARVSFFPNFLHALAAICITFSAFATAQVGIDVNRISAEPTFDDFESMSPRTKLLRK